jgi:uncharacterized protein DUF4184
MAPDFPYFILLTDMTRSWHTVPYFLYSVPAGIAMLWVFHRFLKCPMLSLCPESLQVRVSEEDTYRFWPLPRIFWIAVALIIGAVTHIVWDDFTHPHGYFVEHWAALRMYTPWWPHRPMYSFLQGFCSVIGLALLGVVYIRWLKRAPVVRRMPDSLITPRIQSLIVMLGAIVAAVLGSAYGLLEAGRFPQYSRNVFAVQGLIGAMSAGFLQAMLFSTWWHVRKQRAPELVGSEASQSRSAE